MACPIDYPDEDVALKAICSAGPVLRAIRAMGEAQVAEVAQRSLAPYQWSDGSYRQQNTFRFFLTMVDPVNGVRRLRSSSEGTTLKKSHPMVITMAMRSALTLRKASEPCHRGTNEIVCSDPLRTH